MTIEVSDIVFISIVIFCVQAFVFEIMELKNKNTGR
jgi:hypothetical protein